MDHLTPDRLEVAVLSLLREPQNISLAIEAGITKDAFQVEKNASTWTYITERAARGERSTLADVSLACGVELLDQVADAVGFIEELAKRALARKTRQILVSRLDELENNPAKAVRGILGDLGELRYGLGARAHTSHLDSDVMQRLSLVKEYAEKAKRGELVGIPTGFPCFDSKGDTWKPGEVVAIIGSPNVGKSMLLTWFSSYAYWYGNQKVLFISPESTVLDIAFRVDTILARFLGLKITNSDLRNGAVDLKEYEKYAVQVASRSDWITRDCGDAGVFTVADIISQAREHRPNILAIDGFHLIKGDAHTTWENMKEAAQTLKGLAQSMDMVVIAASQVGRDAVLAADDTPEIGHSAYGMALVETANRVISMAEKRGDQYRRVFKVPKNRDGAKILTRRYMRFDVDHGNIGEVVVRADEDTGMIEI